MGKKKKRFGKGHKKKNKYEKFSKVDEEEKKRINQYKKQSKDIYLKVGIQLKWKQQNQ